MKQLMIDAFNQRMQGFIPEPITLDFLTANPEGRLHNGSSYCFYKLKKVTDNAKQYYILGAYGISRFTNWRFHEIAEDGSIAYEWFCQEGCEADNAEAADKMQRHNANGFSRIKAFGIDDSIF